jgi:hypothetical protein
LIIFYQASASFVAMESIHHQDDEQYEYPHDRLTGTGETVQGAQKLRESQEKKDETETGEEKKECAARELSRERMRRLMHALKRPIDERLDAPEDGIHQEIRHPAIVAKFVLVVFSPPYFLFPYRSISRHIQFSKYYLRYEERAVMAQKYSFTVGALRFQHALFHSGCPCRDISISDVRLRAQPTMNCGLQSLTLLLILPDSGR